ncbi:MAG: V/A-type H+-transporting ATPase subunit I [Rhodothermales bacterium]
MSFWFLLYLSAFFAILVGDAGYGLLLLAGVGIWHRTRGVPPPIFRLCFILGGVTVVWGALSGNWFGSRTLAELPLLAAVVVPDLDVFSVASQQQVMYLSFVLGASHLAVAHGLAAWRVGHALAMVGHLGWLLVLAGAFFLVRFLVLEMPMPGFARWSIGVGAVIAVCCGQPRKGLLATVLAGLGNFPLKAMACFSDLISYIRLFAVGMATFAVAASFNDIASAMYGGRVIMAGIGLLVLILGHTTNILMAGLSVVVHGVRLNLLEFSGHADMQWSGEPYRPFRLSQTHTHK